MEASQGPTPGTSMQETGDSNSGVPDGAVSSGSSVEMKRIEKRGIQDANREVDKDSDEPYKESGARPKRRRFLNSSRAPPPEGERIRPVRSQSGRSRVTPRHLEYDLGDDLMLPMPDGSLFIDSHCHLDFLFDRVRHLGSFEDFRVAFQNSFPM